MSHHVKHHTHIEHNPDIPHDHEHGVDALTKEFHESKLKHHGHTVHSHHVEPHDHHGHQSHGESGEQQG